MKRLAKLALGSIQAEFLASSLTKPQLELSLAQLSPSLFVLYLFLPHAFAFLLSIIYCLLSAYGIQIYGILRCKYVCNSVWSQKTNNATKQMC